MIIIMDFVVFRLLFTQLAFALKAENEKIYDCMGKKDRWIVSRRSIYYTCAAPKVINSFGVFYSSFYEVYAEVHSSR
jgi:hypothetical protein